MVPAFKKTQTPSYSSGIRPAGQEILYIPAEAFGMTTIRHKNLAFTVKEEQEVSAFVFLYIRGVFPYKIRIS